MSWEIFGNIYGHTMVYIIHWLSFQCLSDQLGSCGIELTINQKNEKYISLLGVKSIIVLTQLTN